MTDARLRRVNKEIADCKKDTASRITIELVDESPFHLVGSFDGPEGTPYEGGRYQVDIVVPPTYPFQPVKMKFITKVYHPNVSSASGAICLDILKDAWSPVLTLKSTLISLQSLFCSPEPKDPQDAEVAKHYMTSRESFNETARYWAQTYAGAPGKADAPKNAPGTTDPAAVAGIERPHVDRFIGMGFEETKIIEVLRRLNYRGANVAKVHDDQIVQELLK
ncbi:ubiquitin-conjugating enzyme/RWD-like protein [Auriculariales sp. MPI-PUGE-AT-0066]|nr:ubiquitin-conjugating enzyme/RWD-like protein [Auriculariales sp. MPI-PUGE-AT-0066]